MTDLTLSTALETALNRIEDMIAGDDGQAFIEARKFLPVGRAAVEAALSDAPQQAQPLTDAQKQDIHNATGAGHSLICLVDSYIREQIAVRPSAPTAEPLFAEMIAQHPGLREEMLAESERAEFEAAYRARYPVSCDLDPAKFNRSDVGDYEDIRVSIAWAMWQAARASKGTP